MNVFDPSFDAYEELQHLIKFAHAADKLLESLTNNQTIMNEKIKLLESQLSGLQVTMSSIEELLYLQKFTDDLTSNRQR